jgi:hypothetical protein
MRLQQKIWQWTSEFCIVFLQEHSMYNIVFTTRSAQDK